MREEFCINIGLFEDKVALMYSIEVRFKSFN